MVKIKQLQNRIVGEGNESPEQLLANPKNWRIHPSHQRSALLKVLDTVGWVDQVIVNQTTGHLIDGHLRVSVAMERNEKTVPVLYVSLTEQEEEIVLATLDPIGSLAVADNELLDSLLTEVRKNENLTDLADTVASKYNLLELQEFGELQPIAEEGLPSATMTQVVISFEDVNVRSSIKAEVDALIKQHPEWNALVK